MGIFFNKLVADIANKTYCERTFYAQSVFSFRTLIPGNKLPKMQLAG
jgi:hypothetical protein